MPLPTTTMKAADIKRLADQMTASASGNLVEQVAAIQAESRLAASVIRALLRHVNPSDVFTISEDGATKPATNGAGTAAAGAGESQFVGAVLAGLIAAGKVKNDKKQLYEATLMLRGLWGATFGDTPKKAEGGR